MRACAHEREDHDVVGELIDEQPIGTNMAFPMANPVFPESMWGRQRSGSGSSLARASIIARSSALGSPRFTAAL